MVLHTPFGDVVMQLDGISVEGKIQRTAPNPRWPEVREAYLLHYNYRSDRRAHGLTCLFQGAFQTGGIESGERLELYSIYCGGGKLSIGGRGIFPAGAAMDTTLFGGVLRKRPEHPSPSRDKGPEIFLWCCMAGELYQEK